MFGQSDDMFETIGVIADGDALAADARFLLLNQTAGERGLAPHTISRIWVDDDSLVASLLRGIVPASRTTHSIRPQVELTYHSLCQSLSRFPSCSQPPLTLSV
jgi:hypothetical protein